MELGRRGSLVASSTCPSDPRRSCTTQSEPPLTDYSRLEALYTRATSQDQATETTGWSGEPLPQTISMSLEMTPTYSADQVQRSCPYPQQLLSAQSQWTSPRLADSGDDFDNYSLAANCEPPISRNTSSAQGSPCTWATPYRGPPLPPMWRSTDTAQYPSHTGLGFHSSVPPPHSSIQFHQQNTMASSTHWNSIPDFNNGLSQEYLTYNPTGAHFSPHPSYQVRYDGLPSGSLSPCSTSLGFEGGLALEDDLSSPPRSEFESQPPTPATNSVASTPASTAPRVDEPYAQLIWKALMSRPSHGMPLQEIYQWFRDNASHKIKNDTKGWQNSIRHNLSMNKGFKKDDNKPTSSGEDNAKKTSEWVLEPWAVENGVESTTRYRKPNPLGRSGGRARQHHSSRRGSPRSRTGRKGGVARARGKATAARRRTAPSPFMDSPPMSSPMGQRHTTHVGGYYSPHPHYSPHPQQQQQQPRSSFGGREDYLASSAEIKSEADEPLTPEPGSEYTMGSLGYDSVAGGGGQYADFACGLDDVVGMYEGLSMSGPGPFVEEEDVRRQLTGNGGGAYQYGAWENGQGYGQL